MLAVCVWFLVSVGGLTLSPPPPLPWWTGNVSWLRECIENRVGINGLDKAGNTALYWACHGGHKGKHRAGRSGAPLPLPADAEPCSLPSDVAELLLSQPNVELNQQVGRHRERVGCAFA